MTVGENIKRLRLEKGLTQKQLGALCNPKMADSAIRRYECGKANPKFETVQKIANALNVPINELMPYATMGNYWIPSEWIGNEDYAPLLEVLKKEGEFSHPNMPTALNQVYQNRLLSAFNKLNELGKEKAIERVDELTEITKYTSLED